MSTSSDLTNVTDLLVRLVAAARLGLPFADIHHLQVDPIHTVP